METGFQSLLIFQNPVEMRWFEVRKRNIYQNEP